MENIKLKKVSFASFLEQFPVLEPPIILGEDSHHAFDTANLPLPIALIDTFILPLEEELPDETTEFVACFRLKSVEPIHVVVYWKASLLNYSYNLVTFDQVGNVIEKRVIAGTFFDGEMLTHSVATIDEDWMISVASGQSNAHSSDFSATNNTAYQMEILPDGNIENI
ncbi:MAG: hypothetical protein R2828_24000 [Saprospiraceae bacterium]